jgi:hypothetical protein
VSGYVARRTPLDVISSAVQQYDDVPGFRVVNVVAATPSLDVERAHSIDNFL